MTKRKWTMLGALAASLLLAGIALAAPGGPSIDGWVMGGGGGSGAAANLTLDGTAGQPVTGLDGSGESVVCAGFWCRAAESPAAAVYLPIVLSK
jgi:hypothetical protein